MYTKSQQLKKNKKPKITNEDKKYLNWLQHKFYPCFVCGTRITIEYHHVKLKSTDKKQHDRLIPLCWKHHHGFELSPHGAPKKWRKTYSMDEQLEVAKKMHQDYLNEN